MAGFAFMVFVWVLLSSRGVRNAIWLLLGYASIRSEPAWLWVIAPAFAWIALQALADESARQPGVVE